MARTACFLIEIIDDDQFEGVTPEFFHVQLALLPFIPNLDLQGVEIEPLVAQVGIIDNERPSVVGFDQNSVMRVVDEDVGAVTLCVNLMQGSGLTVPTVMVHVDLGNESTAGV